MKRSTLILAVTLMVGMAIGMGATGFVSAMHHVKVSEVYQADLVTSDGREASVFLAELEPGANVGKHYHPGDAFAYILEGTMRAPDSSVSPERRGSREAVELRRIVVRQLAAHLR